MNRIKLNNITKRLFCSNAKFNYLVKCDTCKYSKIKFNLYDKNINECTYFIDKKNNYITCKEAVTNDKLCGGKFTKYKEFEVSSFLIVFTIWSYTTGISVPVIFLLLCLF